MDINSIKPIGTSIDIKHPASGLDIGLALDLVSMKDDRVKEIQRKWTNKALRNARKNKAFSAEEIEERTSDLLVAAVTGWSWSKGADGKVASFKGQTPEHSASIVREVFMALPWIADQVDEALGDTSNFFEDPAKS